MSSTIQPISEGFRISPLQKRIWRLPDDVRAACRASCAATIEGALDLTRLRDAIRDVLQRHEILRTTFQSIADLELPAQVIGGDAALPEIIDLASMDAAQQDAEIDAWLRARMSAPFDYERGPLVHVLVARRTPDRHVLAIIASALCADARSLFTLVHEIGTAYAGLPSGVTPAQYADVAEWMNTLLEEPDGEAGREFWRAQPPSPARLARSDRPPFVPRRIARPWSGPPLAGESLEAQLAAAWSIYLQRARLADEPRLGLRLDGRRHRHLEGAIGPYARSVPFAPAIDHQQKMSEVVAAVGEAIRAAAVWQEYFDAPPDGHGDADGISFCLDDTVLPADETIGGLAIHIDRQETCLDRFQLRLSSVRREGSAQVELAWHWDPACYDEADVERIADGYLTLLEDAIARPDARAGELDLVGPRERQQILIDFNDTRDDTPLESVIETLARQAERTPGETAVIDDAGTRLTYGELWQRASAVASWLRAHGVGPEHIVGVMMERSAMLPIALAGVLKAGGAYVPLDPSYPHERLAYMIRDARASVLLTDARSRDHGVAFEGVTLTIEDCPQDARDAHDESDERGDRPAAIDLEQAAYVIYTSGSTGQPKGALISHGALANHMAWMARHYPLEPRDRVLQKTPYSFDASVWEFWAPLLAGATLVMARPGGHQDSEYLAAAVARHEVSILQLVPSQLAMLVDEPALPRCRHLRRVFCGGEALAGALVERLRQQLPGIEVHNLYGPTEVTIDSVVWPCAAGESGPVPIGRPVTNIQAYVLDGSMRPQPIGAPGELFLGGAGVARGYLHRPGLTAARFVPHPWGTRGERLYQTGDVVRWRRDGVLEYLGRADDQVKLRGHRIELGEIEMALAAQPGVRRAAAIVREDTPGNQRLVGYVTTDASSSDGLTPGAPRGADLRAALREVLPEPMIPAAIVIVESLPLLPNGKLDREALPLPPRVESGEYEPPRGPVEEVVAATWCRVLGLERIDRRQNFFDAGGHSLLATQVIARLRKAFGVDVPLAALFDVPTVAGLSAEIEPLLQSARALEVPPIVRQPRATAPPLSYAQQRLWFVEQLTPGNVAYNIAGAVRLRGVLSVEALTRAFQTVVDRHEILRTTFAAGADGEPRQIVATTLAVRFRTINLRDRDDREAEMARLAHEEETTAFDLTEGPLFRVVLLEMADAEHVLLFTTHHIISDGWSGCVLVNELAAAYEDVTAGLPVSLPPLPVQYADYAIWQRQWLRGDVLDRQLEWWRAQLEGAPGELDLPVDHARGHAPTFRGGQRKFVLSPEVTRGIRALGHAAGVTPFMIGLAAYSALLHRYSGQDRIVVGTPIAGRHHPETEPLIGLFLNTLPICTDVGGNPTFRELVRRVRTTTVDAYTHQDIPLDRLVEALQPERASSHHAPFFHVTYIHETAPPRPVRVRGLEVEGCDTHSAVAKFDLRLGLFDNGETFTGSFVYDAALFEPATIERIVTHFEHLLTGAIASPDRRVRDLPLLGMPEHQAMLVDWNTPTGDAAPDVCLHQLFERQARETPDAVAVVESGGRCWSYRELNEAANRVAHGLRVLGAGRGTSVCLYLDRRLDAIAAVIGTLKAGATYVPVVPGHPAARVVSVWSQANVQHVIASAAYVERLAGPDFAAHAPAHIVTLEDLDRLGGGRIDDPPPHGNPDDLAYILFTSGSTGVPKGVTMQHRPVVGVIHWLNRAYAIGPHDRMLAVSSLTFDLSVYDIFGMLAAGASLHVAAEADVRDPERLSRLLVDEPITFWNSAPAVLEQVTPLLERGLVSTHDARLRLVFLSGDWIPIKLPDAVRRAFPAARVIALGGATEAAIWSNQFEVGAVDPEWRSIPYGRAIARAHYYVLDAALNPCPIGVRGDLYIGGECLSAGYLGQPAVTAAAYLPDPFSDRAGGRLYRTGDEARWKPDGQIEFLGRRDQQVKIRGFRIELGEIEAVVAAHPGVRDVVAAVRADSSGDRRLVAYVVQHPDASVRLADLRDVARSRLPDYMVPTAFVMLDRLPLSPNGKVDRQALPDPPRPVESADAIAQAGSETEAIIARIWAEMLDLEPPGVEDNFFELGGHSLLATQVMSRVRERFAVDLPLATFFEAPTIAGLARHIDARLAIASSDDGPIPRAQADLEPPLSFAQQRLWFLEQLSPGTAVYSIPAAVRLKGSLDADALEQAINTLIVRHDALRTAFPVGSAGEPVQRVAPTLRLVLETTDLRSQPPGEREEALTRLIAAEEQRPFDLENGPLVRAGLVRLADDDHVLLFTMHHVVSDGWSIGILVAELAACYEARTAGREPVLPELPIRYIDYAIWQRGWLRGDALDRQATYWRTQLTGAPPLLALPTDHPRPASPSFGGAQHSMAVPSRVASDAKALGQQHSATLFMTLLAAYAVVMRHLSGQSDLVIGTDIANRNRIETEGLVGFFANQLALRLDLSGTPDFVEILARVQAATVGAYAHQDLPFARVVEEVAPVRDASYAPLCQVKLVLQNTPRRSFDVSGLTLTDITPERPVVKYDLLTTVWETAEDMQVQMLYSTDLFLAPTIARFAALFAASLEAGVRQPRAPLSELLSALSGADHRIQADLTQGARARRAQQYRRATRRSAS